VEVPVPVPRTRAMLDDPAYRAVRADIDNRIHHAATTPAERLPIFRMTPVGDELW